MVSKTQVVKMAILKATTEFVTVYFFRDNGDIDYITFSKIWFGCRLPGGGRLGELMEMGDVVGCVRTNMEIDFFDCRRVFRMRTDGREIMLAGRQYPE